MLRVSDVTAAYGDVRVVDDVSLEVAAGEVVGILGPNGAGQDQPVRLPVRRRCPLSEGTVTLLGQDITRLPPHKRAERGLMRSFQSVRLFPSLTVRDCIAVALETRLTVKSAAFAGLWLPPARAEERRVDERVDVLLELLRLEKRRRHPGRRRCRWARAAWSTWPASSPPDRRCCCSTSRPRASRRARPSCSVRWSSRISSDLDCAVLIIEHNVQVLASVAHRLVAMHARRRHRRGRPVRRARRPRRAGRLLRALAVPTPDLVPTA